MNAGDRVIVVGGPWPERRGEHGVIVDGPAIYPFHGISKHEVVVLLDDDPLTTRAKVAGGGQAWSHVICVRDLVPE